MRKELINRIISSIILIVIAFFFIIKGSFLFNFFILICFGITAYEWHKMTKKKSYYIFGFIFLIISFFTVYQLRNEFYGNFNYFIMILLICISSDIGGYIFGKLFKGPKLTKFSPNKTYAGMLGSYLLPTIVLSFYFNNLNFLNNIGIQATSKEISLFFFIFILLISTISQLGDIIISYFKRLSKIKDTGKIIPGHGGILDRVDGMIFAFPFGYIVLKLNIFQYF
jgi:phosphatidate cytidylyltransferase|tara:strand:- start:7303 stop:7977 length:675 start_codon:yes stop_codon:yes gene_type:complete